MFEFLKGEKILVKWSKFGNIVECLFTAFPSYSKKGNSRKETWRFLAVFLIWKTMKRQRTFRQFLHKSFICHCIIIISFFSLSILCLGILSFLILTLIIIIISFRRDRDFIYGPGGHLRKSEVMKIAEPKWKMEGKERLNAGNTYLLNLTFGLFCTASSSFTLFMFLIFVLIKLSIILWELFEDLSGVSNIVLCYCYKQHIFI